MCITNDLFGAPGDTPSYVALHRYRSSICGYFYFPHTRVSKMSHYSKNLQNITSSGQSLDGTEFTLSYESKNSLVALKVQSDFPYELQASQRIITEEDELGISSTTSPKLFIEGQIRTQANYKCLGTYRRMRKKEKRLIHLKL